MNIVEVSPAELPSFAEDRNSFWAAMRALGPVVRMDGSYWLTRRDDVLAALRDEDIFGREPFLLAAPLKFDLPAHARWRRMLQPFFSARALNELRPALRRQAADLVDATATKGSCEAMTDVAAPFAAEVVLSVLGLPLDVRDRVLGWKDADIAIKHSHVRAIQGGAFDANLGPKYDMYRFLTQAVKDRRRDVERPGLLSTMLGGDDPLDDGEAIAVIEMFFGAGIEPVSAAIGFALFELAQSPSVCLQLRSDPKQIPGFVDDVLRREPPSPVVMRITTAEVTVAGVTIPVGSQVFPCLGAITQEDATVVGAPSNGTRTGYWTFSAGPHRCLAAILVRMAMTELVGEWLRAIPEFQLGAESVPTVDVGPAVKLSSVPLRWDTALRSGTRRTAPGVAPIGVPEIDVPQPGWRFWFRYGDRLISPFEAEIAEGPLIAAFEHSPGVHFVPDIDDLFTHQLLRFSLQPHTVDADSLTDDERGAWDVVRGVPGAVTFGAGIGGSSIDPHPLSGGTVMRARGYRICAIVTPDAEWQDSLGARYACAVEVASPISLERCRQIDDAMKPRIAHWARQPLPPAGKTRLVWRDGRPVEIPIRRAVPKRSLQDQVEQLARVIGSHTNSGLLSAMGNSAYPSTASLPGK